MTPDELAEMLDTYFDAAPAMVTRIWSAEAAAALRRLAALEAENARLVAGLERAIAECWCGGKGRVLFPDTVPGSVYCGNCTYCIAARETLRLRPEALEVGDDA